MAHLMPDADFQTLSLDRRDDGVAILTLDRPRSANAISAQLSRELYDIVQLLRGDPAVRVLVVTGAGRHFCAGADLRDPEQDAPGWMAIARRGVDALAALEIPVIAGLNGTAVGGGMELALACDIRVAQPGVKLGMPEIKIGALPGAGGLSRLQAVIGSSAAMTLVMSGRIISAEEGERLGLVSLAGAGASAVESAIVLGEELAQMAPYATRTAKLIFRQALGQAPDASMATEYALIDRMATPEQQRAEQRRAAKRDPVYARIFADSAEVSASEFPSGGASATAVPPSESGDSISGGIR
jgi:methylglutaconyl-CoA hydratase